jgi:hypothetical protein
MTAKGGTKTPVTLYYMSQHFGICTPVDVIKKIIVKEKEAWVGAQMGLTSFDISKRDLFGGDKKEGGVEGTVYFLPGYEDQVLPDVLAQKLGRADGADCPGYRGLASIFFIGTSSQSGFYWTANNPYLPGVWVTVTRRPRGLNQDYAMVPRQNTTSEFPYSIETDNTVGSPTEFSTDGRTLYQINGSDFAMWSMDSMTLQSSVTLSPATVGNVAISPDRIYAQTGPFFDPVLGSFDLGGLDYQELVPTSGFPSFTEGCTWAANLVCFYRPANTAGSVVYDPRSGLLSEYAVSFGPTGYCTDDDDPDEGWVVGTDAIAGTGLYLAPIASLDETEITGGFDGPAYVTDNGDGNLLIWQEDNFLLIDKTTRTVTATATAVGGVSVAQNAFRVVEPGASSIWMGDTEYDTRTLALIRTIDPNNWVSGEWHLQSTIYSPYKHALVTWPAFLSPNLVFRLLDRGAEDANPAHIIYECLTNTDWGMGSPSSLIDVDSFEAAGVTLFNEPLGLSLMWTKQAAIQDFVQEILDHIQGALFVDPQTGLLTLKLIRGDYDVDTLPTISPSTANLTNFGRKLWGEIVNEITVTWTNPDNEQEETVTAHDLASITTQGGIVPDSRNYYGVRYADLAMRLAARDLRSAGSPLAMCDAEVDRSLWYLRPASVLLLDWPEYGLDGVVMRVTSIDYGKPGDMTIKLSLIEDVFGLDAADYVAPPTSSWVDPSSEPAPVDEETILTLPYYLAFNGIASIDGAAYPEVLAGVLAASANTDTFGFELWGEVVLADSSTEWEKLASLNLAGHAELGSDIAAEASGTGVTLSSFVGSAAPRRNGLAIIGGGTEAENEIALITAASTTFSLSRGILDTIPRAWAAGTPVWFIATDTLIEDPTARSVGEVVSYRLLTRTSKGLLSLYAAPIVTATLTDRPWLPLRPANVTIGGVQFNDVSTPVNMIGASVVPVTWSNRNRLTEDAAVLAWTDSTVTPETGQTTTLTVLKTDGVTVLATHTGITGNSFDIPIASFGSEAFGIVRATSSRTDSDGTFESLQGIDIYVQVDVAVPVGTAIEMDTALALSPAVGRSAGRSDEADSALAMGVSGGAVMATETDTALALSATSGGVTGEEFRIRPITAGRTSEPYMRLGGIEFLSGGSMPGGYTAFSSGLAAGTTANLFDGNSSTNAAMNIDGSSNAGVTFPSAQSIDTVRLNAGLDFITQYAREWVLEYRVTAGTGSWVEAHRFYSGQFTSNETRSFSVAGDENSSGYRYFKATIVSNYGDAGTNTYFVELGIVDEDGTTEIQRDFKSATNFGGSMGGAEYLYNLVYADDNYDLISGIPADITLDWGRKKLPSKIKIGFRNSPYEGQGPNRIQVYGSNDNFSSSTLLLDTGSNAAPTGGEIRTFTIP